MNRNWYALILVCLLGIGMWRAGLFVDHSIREIESDLAQAYSLAQAQHYNQATQAFDNVIQKANACRPFWTLLVRRSLVDQLNQTLATIPFYTTPENQSDLAVETARAQTQARQIRQSFFSWF